MARLWSQPCNALSAWINTVFCYAGQNCHFYDPQMSKKKKEKMMVEWGPEWEGREDGGHNGKYERDVNGKGLFW